MFTLEQIQQAHSKVKSGPDFPQYIRELKKMGVSFYNTYVNDGHTDYYSETEKLSSPAKYPSIIVSEKSDVPFFLIALKEHQQGHTDYLTFINQCAKSGINSWEVCLDTMTCTYFDTEVDEVHEENIPE